MSTRTPPARTPAREAAQTFRAELSKLRTLPATWLTIGGTWAVTLALAAAFVTAERQAGAAASSLETGLAPVTYTQAGLLVLGVLAATSEHTGGQLRTTLTAMPRRVTQRLAATMALLLVTFPTAAVTLAASTLLAHLTLGAAAEPPELTHAVGTIAGAATYLTLTAMLAAAIGVVLRRTLPAVAILIGYFVVVGPLLRDYTPDIARYLPDTAGVAMWSATEGDEAAISPGASWAIVSAWSIVAVIVSLVVHQRRDA